MCELDSMCKFHDNENSETEVGNIRDIVLAHRADKIANNPMLRHKILYFRYNWKLKQNGLGIEEDRKN